MLFGNSKADGMPLPELDYIFLGKDVIVTGINNDWMKNLEKDTTFDSSVPFDKLIIPEGVTKIAESAFIGIQIKNIILPSTLKEIGAFAFFNNKALTSINFSDAKLKRIGSYAFAECTNLDLTLKVYKTFTVFEDGVFTSCKSVKIIFEGHPSVYRIGKAAFMGTYIDMILPDTVKEFAPYAFYYAESANNVVFPYCATSTDYFVGFGCGPENL